MIGFIFGLGIITFLLWIGFQITGAIFIALIWLFIKVPLAIIVGLIGLVLCCTIILIPVGLWFLKTGLRLIVPGGFI